MSKHTHKLVMARKDKKGIQSTVGSAWKNDKGWFTIVLNDGITLSFRDKDDFYLSMYPIQEVYQAHEGSFQVVDVDDSDIPF